LDPNVKAQRQEEAQALAQLVQAGGHLADVLVLLVESELVMPDVARQLRTEVQHYQVVLARYGEASRKRSLLRAAAVDPAA
jgi:hypothetical protein